MTHLLNDGQQSGPPAMEFIRYRVIGKLYSKWRAIIAEAMAGQGDTMFKVALYQGFNIRIDDPKADPMIYIIQDSAQMRELAEQGVHNPTFCQLFFSTKIVSLSEEDAIAQMQKWMEANKVQTGEP